MNTDRRSFLKSILVATVAPTLLLPKLGNRQRWKRTEEIWVPNPEWVNAEHEIFFVGLNGIKILEGYPVFDDKILSDSIKVIKRPPARF